MTGENTGGGAEKKGRYGDMAGIPVSADTEYTVRPIGIIESCFQEKFATPRQPGLVKNSISTIRIFQEYIPGHSLSGLEGFSHLWVLGWMHLNTNKSFRPKIHPPRLRGAKMGIFATRSPHRPNPLAISVAKIEKIEGNLIHLSGLDFINGTPVIDIKPYLKLCDCLPEAKDGLIEENSFPELEVVFTEQAEEDLKKCGSPGLKDLITETLASDPRNRRDGTQMGDGFEMGFFIANHDVHFAVRDGKACVLRIETGKKFEKKFRRDKRQKQTETEYRKNKEKKMKKIAVFTAFRGFRDEEYLEPKAILESAGIQITTVSTKKGEALGKLGAKIQTDCLISDVNTADYDALTLVGGPGALSEFDNPAVHAIFTKAQSEGKIIGAICISPMVLAHAGLLKGKKATVWTDGSNLEDFKNCGAEYTAAAVERDGRIITANGPAAAKEYANALIDALK